MIRANALTIASTGLLRELKTDIKVGTPILDRLKGPEKLTDKVTAVWDTGATGSVITQTVVDRLGIQPISMVMVHGVGSSELSPVFLVDFYLPMGVVVQGLNVTQGQLVGADALIGMDVIAMGDFAITNFRGKTKMTFRVPSLADLDFVRETNQQQTSRAQRRAAARSASKKR